MAKKRDPITSVPETLTAPWIKRFFKEFFDIPVRVRAPSSSKYVRIWILCDSRNSQGRALSWSHEFPEELGNRCMRIIYPNSEKLREQNWGGNINAHDIAMHRHELQCLFGDLVDERNAVC